MVHEKTLKKLADAGRKLKKQRGAGWKNYLRVFQVTTSGQPFAGELKPGDVVFDGDDLARFSIFLSRMKDADLVSELERRGWKVELRPVQKQ